MTLAVNHLYGAWVVTIGGHAVGIGYKTIGGARLYRWALMTGRATL